MSVKIPKWIILASITVIIATLGILIFFTYFNNSPLGKCTIFTGKIETVDCGIYGNAEDGSAYFISGKVISKNSEDLTIDIATADAKSKKITFAISFAEAPNPTSIFDLGKMSLLDAKETYASERITARETFNRIKPGANISMQILNYKVGGIDKIKPYIKDKRFPYCSRYNTDLISMLKFPSLIKNINLYKLKVLDKCSITIFSLTI